VRQDLLDHRPLLDRRDEVQTAAAVRASENVELEGPAKKVCPENGEGTRGGGAIELIRSQGTDSKGRGPFRRSTSPDS
jgi:hypothetical protein